MQNDDTVMNDADATSSLQLPSPLSLSPRGLIRARAAGLIPALIARLKKPVDSTRLKNDALLLEKVLCDIDAGLEFAVRGGHAPLSRLLSHALVLNNNNNSNDDDEDDDDTALDTLANCAALAMNSLPSGWPSGFPAPARLDALEAACASPLIFDFSSFADAPPVDADMLGRGDEITTTLLSRHPPPLAAPLRVFVRLVSPLRARQTSQEDVGFALWPAAIPLSRWLVAHRGYLLCNGSRRVLEIGAGVGLTGIVAALAASKKKDDGALTSAVWLTDFNPKVLDNLARNAQLNEPLLHHGGDDNELAHFASEDGEPRLRIARDDWSQYKLSGGNSGNSGSYDSSSTTSSTSSTSSPRICQQQWEPRLPSSSLFDVILGSDMICSKSDAEGVAALLAARLSPDGGIAILLLPPNDVRWGVDAFPDAMTTAGLVFETRLLSPIFLSATYPPQTFSHAQGLVEAEMTTASGYESRAQLFIIRKQK